MAKRAMPEDSLYDIKKLLLQVGEGNESAFRAVFNFFKERFYAVSLKMTHSGDIAEEIVQEVFVSLWIKRVQVAAASNPENYLFTILHNCIYSHFRKLALEKELKKKMGEQLLDIEESPVEDSLLEKENRKMLESLVSRLPAQQQVVYNLSRRQGMSRDQIAVQLHISPNTVKNHLNQATRFIRSCYKAGVSIFIVIAAWQSF